MREGMRATDPLDEHVAGADLDTDHDAERPTDHRQTLMTSEPIERRDEGDGIATAE